MVGDRPLEVAQDHADVAATGRHRVSADVAAREEPVGEPDGAELEAAGGQRLALLAEEQLGGTPADVHEEHPLIEHRHRLQHSEVDQAGLFGTRDHLDVDPRLIVCSVEEDLGVRGLAHCAGGDGAKRGAVAVGDAAHPPEARDTAVDRSRGEQLHVATPVPEPNHLPLPGHGLEAVTGDAPGDHEVEAVRAHIQCGEDQI